MTNDNDDESTTSATPAQQCLFWSLSVAFMLKLGCFVVVAVIIHNNEWILIKPTNYNFVFVRGISFDDCAYPIAQPELIQCIKWSVTDETERHRFWHKYDIDYLSIYITRYLAYTCLYYICLALLIWYLVDMYTMLVMCCRQKQSSNINVCQRQWSMISMIFIVFKYILVYVGLIYSRQTNFVQVQSDSKTYLGIGAKIFIMTFVVYLLASLVQHIFELWSCFETLRQTRISHKQLNWNELFDCFQQHHQSVGRNTSSATRQVSAAHGQEFEMHRLRDIPSMAPGQT